VIGAVLLRVARSRPAARWLGWLFARHSRWLPVRRLRETDDAIAFWHPRPAYPVHVLIVPKRALAALADLKPGEPNPAGAMLALAVAVARDLALERCGYRLVLNGGAFQDVQQLHLHLIGTHADR
jgi:histidine triad (HIT) family protein